MKALKESKDLKLVLIYSSTGKKLIVVYLLTKRKKQITLVGTRHVAHVV